MLTVSILLDYLLTNYLNYEIGNISIFPMFTITYIAYQLLTDNDIKKIIIGISIYSILSGVIGINLLFLLIILYLIKYLEKKDITNYFIIIAISLITYDSLFYLILNLFRINTYTLDILIIKLFRSLPINLIYSNLLILNYCSTNKIDKYKYIEMITWQKSIKKRRKKING